MRQKAILLVQSLKDGYDFENQAWRRALADKARKQVADKESDLRRALEAERDRQIELVCIPLLVHIPTGMAMTTMSKLFTGHPEI